MKRNRKDLILFALNILIGLVIISPIIYAVSMAFMTPDEIFRVPPKLIPSSMFWGNFEEAINSVPIFRFIFNSFFVALCITAGQIITACLAAYAFAFYEFRGKKIIFIAILATMMIPGEATIISNYLTISSLGLLDTYRALIIPFTTSAMGIFMMRQYYLTVPRELKEAALIDGSNSLQFLVRILIPISKPIMGALGVYVFLSTWNQYMWPLLVTSSQDMRTVQIGITMLKSSEAESYGVILSGIVMIILPSLAIFIFGQKQLIEGMTTGSVKG